MRIGVDLDGVVYNSENWFMAMAEFYDLTNKGNGIVDASTNNVQKRYGLSDEVAREFRLKYLPLQINESPLMPFAIESINYLHSLGHKIYIITARGGVDESHKELTKVRLKKDNVYFDELYFTPDGKVETCHKLEIDVMIDDSASVVEELSNNNINCIQFKADNTRTVNASNVEVAYNWGEVLRLLNK